MDLWGALSHLPHMPTLTPRWLFFSNPFCRLHLPTNTTPWYTNFYQGTETGNSVLRDPSWPSSSKPCWACCCLKGLCGCCALFKTKAMMEGGAPRWCRVMGVRRRARSAQHWGTVQWEVVDPGFSVESMPLELNQSKVVGLNYSICKWRESYLPPYWVDILGKEMKPYSWKHFIEKKIKAMWSGWVGNRLIDPFYITVFIGSQRIWSNRCY